MVTATLTPRANKTDELIEFVEHFRRRVLQDALAEATAAYWLRRVEMFEWAKPRLNDYPGRATRQDLGAAWRRCDEIARGCRGRARVSILGGEDW